MYHCSEVTHPGLVHAEIDLPDWAKGFVIGRMGSELKHIQGNFRVQVNIPRDHSLNKQTVIVGAKEDVDRAVAYIEKKIEAAKAPKGRDAPDAEEDKGRRWNDENE